MEAATLHDRGTEVREQLLDRRSRLESVIERAPDAQLAGLLANVDAALDRLDRGTFGTCDVCRDPVEADRIARDPLIRTCLGCLTAAERRALERDLDLAGRVQRALLPPPTFRVDGWEAAYEYHPIGLASGDYVDLVPLDSGELVFLVGDVAGKGVAASLLMTHLHAIVRSLIAMGLPFRELVERTNRIFHESGAGTRYATLVCGKAMPGGEIELSNAGHCPPIWLRDGSAVTLPPTSVPIGLFRAAPFPTTRVTLASGDALVLYTDGITETTDADGCQYGVERLLSALEGQPNLAVPDLVSRGLSDLALFRADTAGRDDVTLFVLRRRRDGTA